MLNKLGIKHENEKIINNIYIVDIFINNSYFIDTKQLNSIPNSNSKSTNPTTLGVVIEVDGPKHYDSYLNTPLGPTIMKKRHLELLNYIVCNNKRFVLEELLCKLIVFQ